MIATIDQLRKEATLQLDQSTRSQLGQYMTPSSIAGFMASIFSEKDCKSIHLLDAGAGIGSLTTAFLEKQLVKSIKPKEIEVTAYEIDRVLLDYLKNNLADFKNVFKKHKVGFKSQIVETDFIKDAVLKITAGNSNVFTHAILNPPYKKINSLSDHRKFLRIAHFETVNLYSAFVGLALKLLKDNGELVAIIPRSFCNGNYYKAFRYLITDFSAIKQIHLFESRTNAFKDDEVLQENIILYLEKNGVQGDVIISQSPDATFEGCINYTFKFDQIIKPGDAEKFIHIPSFGENYLEDSNEIVHTLKDLSLEVSTGPVVDFRSKDFIYKEPVENSVPLLYPTHFNGTGMEWPKAGKKPNAIIINSETLKMFYPSGFYTVVKRFSSKEEKQRVVARVINPTKFNSQYVGIENHLNVFHFKKNGISENVAYGLAAYLNSSYVDTHFRTFNGHTQVNATDLKQLKYPNLKALTALGKWAKKLDEFDQERIDQQIKKIL